MYVGNTKRKETKKTLCWVVVFQTNTKTCLQSQTSRKDKRCGCRWLTHYHRNRLRQSGYMVPRFSSGTWFGPRKQATAMVNIFEPHFCRRCRTCSRTGFDFTSENPAGMPVGVFRPLDAEGRAVRRCSKMFDVAKKKYRCFRIWLQNDIKYQVNIIYIYITIMKTYPYTWNIYDVESAPHGLQLLHLACESAWYTTKRFVAFMCAKLCIVGSECT